MKLKCMKPNDPFFALDSGNPVSKHMLIKFLQDKMAVLFPSIDVKEWTGISLRKGGATSALRAGVAGDVIDHYFFVFQFGTSFFYFITHCELVLCF